MAIDADEAYLVDLWNKTTETVKRIVIHPSLWKAMEVAVPITIEDGMLVLGFPIGTFNQSGHLIASNHKNAIEKVGKKAPDGILYIGRKALRDALYATKNFKGLTGNLTCNQYGDCADPRIAVYKTSEENIKKLQTPDQPFWKPY